MISTWPDIVRDIVIAEAVVSGGAMLTVLLLYGRAWRLARPDLGLLPLHVALISGAYGGISFLLALGVADSFGRPITWRIPGYGLFLLLGIVALLVMARLQRRRIRLYREGGGPLQLEDDAPDNDEPPRRRCL